MSLISILILFVLRWIVIHNFWNSDDMAKLAWRLRVSDFCSVDELFLLLNIKYDHAGCAYLLSF